jgi:hypothetical protein
MNKINTYEGKQMNILDQKTDKELEQSLLAEVAKASNEIKCARQDLDKATSRLGFLLVVVNELINRQKD